MPDGDIFNRVAARGWSKPLRRLCRYDEPETVARECMQSLAAGIRASQGIPRGSELVLVLSALAEGTITYRTAFAAVQEVERAAETADARIAARTAQQMIAGIGAGANMNNLEQQFIEGTFRELLSHHVFGKAGPDLYGRESAWSQVADYEQKVRGLLEPAVQSFARQLTRRPDAERLRAPSMFRRPKRSTADILNESLD